MLHSAHPIPTHTDGISFFPALTDGKQRRHDYLYWEFYEGGFKQAVRQEDWKLVQTEIFDLKTDLAESKDKAARHPEVAAKLKRSFTSSHTNNPSFPQGLLRRNS